MNEQKRKALIANIVVGGGKTGVELCSAIAELTRAQVISNKVQLHQDQS